MSKPYLIITTVGTSLLNDELITTRDALNNADKHDQGRDIKKAIEDYDDKVKEALSLLNKPYEDYSLSKSKADLGKLSAEIASLIKIKDHVEKERMNNIGKIILLSSDTYSGEFCADVNKLFISNIALADEILSPVKINNLETKKMESFKSGIESLWNILEGINNANKDNFQIALNITGGYKGAIPSITRFARISNCTLFYLHIDSDELLEIEYITDSDNSEVIKESYHKV